MRYRRVAAAIGAIGLIVGLGYGITVPSLVSAKSLVLLPASASNSSGVPARSISTDVQIAMTPAILNPAAKVAGVSLPYTTLVHQVTVTGVTNDVLQFVAKAPTASQAERFANALATTFDTYAANQASLLSSSSVAEWSQEIQQYQSQVNNLQGQITATQKRINTDGPQAAASDQAFLDSLVSSQNADLQLIKLVQSDISLAQISGASPTTGAVVLQRATTAISPSAVRIPMFGVIGLLIGLLIGVAAAFGIGRRDRRLRLRDEISRAAGASVIASLSAVHRPKSEDLLRLLDHFEPSVIDKANLRRLLDELGVERRSTHGDSPISQNGSSVHHENGSSVHHEGVGVHAIVLAGDDQAVAAAVELPAFAASLGIPVALVVTGSNSSTEQLAIACAARDPLEVGATRPNFLTYATSPGKAPGGVSLAVTLEIVDPITLDVADIEPTAEVPGRRESALLVVSSGFAKPEDLEVVALAAEHHGHPLAGVVVADPEPSDKTSGLQQPRRLNGPNGPRQLAELRSTSR